MIMILNIVIKVELNWLNKILTESAYSDLSLYFTKQKIQVF